MPPSKLSTREKWYDLEKLHLLQVHQRKCEDFFTPAIWEGGDNERK